MRALETEAVGCFQAGYDESSWEEIQLPSPENMMKEYGLEDYQGGVWHHRRVFVPAEWEGHPVSLYTMAINWG